MQRAVLRFGLFESTGDLEGLAVGVATSWARRIGRDAKEHEDLLKSIGKGDRIVTAGGIHGEVTGAADDVLTVEIANLKGERVRVKLDRSRVERRLEKAKGAGE